MTQPRRALPPDPSPRGWLARVQDWVRTSWVPAAALSGLMLLVAGMWPMFSPASAPLPAQDSVGPIPLVPQGIPSTRAITEDGPAHIRSAVITGSRPPAEPEPSALDIPDGARLVIGSVGIAAPLDLVGLVGDEVEIPADPARVGLYSEGSRPGDPTGTVLVTGHVSWNSERGALWHLAGVQVGDIVELTPTGDPTSFWFVTSVHTVPRDQDHPDLFDVTGEHRLVVVTCGGPVVNGSYRDLVVVEAAPA